MHEARYDQKNGERFFAKKTNLKEFEHVISGSICYGSEVIFNFSCFVVLLRFSASAKRAIFYNPISPKIVKVQPYLFFLRKVNFSIGPFDTASLFSHFLSSSLTVVLLY